MDAFITCDTSTGGSVARGGSLAAIMIALRVQCILFTLMTTISCAMNRFHALELDRSFARAADGAQRGVMRNLARDDENLRARWYLSQRLPQLKERWMVREITLRE